MSKLLIVESPAKAKTIMKYLGPDYRVEASMGHLRDLPKKEFGVDVERRFEATYIPIEGKDKTINLLKSACKKSSEVFLATDPDREGEAISWHLYELLGLDAARTKRITFNEITKKAVQDAVAAPRELDMDLIDAQQARRILDRIVGYKLSPFLWRKVRKGLSAGRVQSVVVRLIVDREREIQAFVPQEYWSIDVSLRENGVTFTARFYGDQSGKMDLHNQAETDAVLRAIDGCAFTVQSVKKAKKKRQPAPPFITSTLQQDASRKLSMTARRTMSVAQELYEGVELAGLGMTGLITYMRTDSLRISSEALSQARTYIGGRFGPEYRPANARVFRSKKNAQDAHECIRPSDPGIEPDAIKKSLTPDQYKLYKLIWSRFIASQMSDAVLDTTLAEIASAGYMFRATGQTIAFPGFLALYEESVDDAPDEQETLPALEAGQTPEHVKTEPKQHFTQPPPRYTEASLIRAMEEKGIGRPSTYAPTISVVIDRDYVVKEGKALRPTALGEAVTDLMIDKFTDIIDVQFTAQMEDKLDEVESGAIDYRELLADFYAGFASRLAQAEKDLDKQRIKVRDEESDVVCDLCGRKMVIKSGRFGKFLACPGYPDCKNTKPLFTETGVSCPVCGARLVKKKSKSGYYYYGCEKNPTCPFMTWDTPTKAACPRCNGVLYKRYTKTEKKNLCHVPDCGYEEPLAVKAEKGEGKKPSARAKKGAEAAGETAAAQKKAAAKPSARGKKADAAQADSAPQAAGEAQTSAAASAEAKKPARTRKTAAKAPAGRKSPAAKAAKGDAEGRS